MKIDTPRLSLINCDKKIVEVVLQGDEALRQYLQINIPAKWTEFGEPAF